MYEKEIKLAKKARLNAYCPYSKFQVGAALKCKNGKIYTGCNIENNGIQSICAERVAFSKALSDGIRDFVSITVVGGPKDKEPIEECMPCGYCRQFISEFTDENFKIITLNNNYIKEYAIKDILPYSFKL